jgi:HTH-type transcriptional regulator/antitoxin HigA
MHVDALQTEADYRAALSRVSALVSLDPAIDSADGNKLATLSARVEQYERERFPFPQPTAAEAIRFRIEQAGTSDADLRRYIGEPDVVAAVLRGDQPLSQAMIQRIHEGLQIPPDILCGS